MVAPDHEYALRLPLVTARDVTPHVHLVFRGARRGSVEAVRLTAPVAAPRYCQRSASLAQHAGWGQPRFRATAICGVLLARALHRRRQRCLRSAVADPALEYSEWGLYDDDAEDGYVDPPSQFGKDEASYLAEFDELSEDNCDTGRHVVEEMREYLHLGYDAEKGYTAALRGLLNAGAIQAATKLFKDAQGGGAFVSLPLDIVSALHEVFGRYGQWKAGFAHIRYSRGRGMSDADATHCLNALLTGVLTDATEDNVALAETLLEMAADDAGAKPDGDTLAIMLQGIIECGRPKWIAEVGRMLVFFTQRCSVMLEPVHMTLVSTAHMMRGDMDAAYLWFLLTQFETEHTKKLELNDETFSVYISQLVRALALAGQVPRLMRVLTAVREAGGKLPEETTTMSIAGFTAGRTMATVWLEPGAEHVRRRSIWCSDEEAVKSARGMARGTASGFSVRCAQQSDWARLDLRRHERYQWAPYLSPDTKLERAWLSPLRNESTGLLGLMREWVGETPMALAARERLGEGRATEEVMTRALRWSLALEPPRAENDSPPMSILPLEERSWRAYHADFVPSIYNIDDMKRVIANDFLGKLKKNKLGDINTMDPMLIPFTEITTRVATLTTDEQKALFNTPIEYPSDWLQENLGFDYMDLQEVHPEQQLKLAEFARALVDDMEGSYLSKPLTVPEFIDWIRAVPDEKFAGQLKADGISSVVPAETSSAVLERISRENEEDRRYYGTALEEIHLAVSVVIMMQHVGLQPSPADINALCAASHAAGSPQLADIVLQSVSSFALPPTVVGEAQGRPAVPATPTVAPALADAMVTGGWERNSVELFLAGQVPTPKRDETTLIGKHLTRFLDPLLGTEGDRESCFRNLAYPKDTVNLDAMYDEDGDVMVTKRDVLKCIMRNPEHLDILRRASERDTDIIFRPGNFLKRVGLPVPKDSTIVQLKAILEFASRVAEDYYISKTLSLESLPDALAAVAGGRGLEEDES